VSNTWRVWHSWLSRRPGDGGMVKTRLAWVLGARDACMAFTSYRSQDPEIPKKSNVIIQTSDNNNWIF
jgi:hypothetical protein